MSKEREYRIISPLSTPQGIFKDGIVTLTEELANELLALPEPPIADPNQPPQSEGSDADKKSGAKAGAGTGGGAGEKSTGGVTQEQIIEAIGTLEVGNEAHWTKGNKPDTNVLADRLNTRISAAERDEAWRVYQERQAPTQ